MNPMLRSFLLAGLVLAAAADGMAQVPTGQPAFGSFAGGPDVVDLSNLNVQLAVPIVNKAGRGTPFSYTLTFDTSVWYPAGVSGSQVWTPVVNWGWQAQTQVLTGYVTYRTTRLSCWCVDCVPRPMYLYYLSYTFSTFQDRFGAVHTFSATASQASPCGDADATTDTVTLTDGSGYTIYVDSTPSATIYPRGGGTYNPPLQTGTGSATYTDPNGNQITTNGSTFTDTLGTTALTVSGSSPVNFTVTPPSGTNVSYVMNYTIYTVATNFAAPGITEYGRTSVPLVSTLVLPDNSKYTFAYETTPGACTPLSGTYSANCVTGRLASVQLPTGGTTTYTYSGGYNGILGDGSASTVTRATPDGTWTYSQVKGTGAASTTTITAPVLPNETVSNVTVVQFQGLYETQRQSYEGSTSGTLLQTVNTCYNGSTSPCTGTAVALPITQRTVIIQPGGSLQCKHNYLYNAYGLPTELDDYDYGSGAPGSLIRKVLITYASLGNGIVSQPASVTVQNGSGATAAQTTFTYDQGTPTPTSGTPQHVAVSGSRGNATTVSTLVQGSTSLSKLFTYYDTGTANTATDVNGAVTTYKYSSTGSCGNSFVTSVSLPLSLSASQTWNCTGAVMLTSTDANGQNTTATYTDPYFWRPYSATDALGYVIQRTYTPTSVESSLLFNSGSSTLDVLSTVDGLGRPYFSQQRQAPGSANWDSVERAYNSVGSLYWTSMPYSGAAGAGTSNSVSALVTNHYDNLGRNTWVGTWMTNGSLLGPATATFSQNDVLVNSGPAAGENQKQRQLEYDALGRLTSVCEITSGAGSGTCGQTSAQIGYWTKYTYDAAGRLTGVAQNAQGTQQTRSYAFDFTGRLTSETNPESGTTSYVYDSDATCGNSSGDLVKRSDAVGNVTCYAYDVLHRVTSISYPSGTYMSVTPMKVFYYDASHFNTTYNTKGRLASAGTCQNPTCAGSWITAEDFSYSARGELTDVFESTPHSGGWYHVSSTYWGNGALNSINMNLSGVPSWAFGVDGEGRINGVWATPGWSPLVSSAAYNPYASPPNVQVTLGSGDSDSFQFDVNTGRMTQYKYTVGATPQSVIGNLSGTRMALSLSLRLQTRSTARTSRPAIIRTTIWPASRAQIAGARRRRRSLTMPSETSTRRAAPTVSCRATTQPRIAFRWWADLRLPTTRTGT
jgi:hypothetical protein